MQLFRGRDQPHEIKTLVVKFPNGVDDGLGVRARSNAQVACTSSDPQFAIGRVICWKHDVSFVFTMLPLLPVPRAAKKDLIQELQGTKASGS